MDEAVFITLCQEHMASFYRMAFSIVHNQADAEDAVQQALLNAWRARAKTHVGLEKAWIMRIVINESIGLLRRRRRVIPMEDFPCATVPINAEAAGLHEAIRTLPENLRTPLLLKYMEGMTEKEIATALHMPLSSVKNRLYRARKALQKLLNEEVSP